MELLNFMELLERADQVAADNSAEVYFVLSAINIDIH